MLFCPDCTALCTQINLQESSDLHFAPDIALVKNNAKVAAQIAVSLSQKRYDRQEQRTPVTSGRITSPSSSTSGKSLESSSGKPVSCFLHGNLKFVCVCWGLFVGIRVYLRDRSAQTILRAAKLR